MLPDGKRKQIQDIIQGAVLTRQVDHLTAIRNFLCGRYPTSTTVKVDFESQSIVKKEQAELIKTFIAENNLWVKEVPPEERFLAEGGEAREWF